MNSEIISIMTAKKIHNYDRVIELLLYALLPKELYNRELDRDTKRKYINIIENNLKQDTTLKYQAMQALQPLTP